MPDSLTRILYVEDDPDIAEVATMALEEFGAYEVHHCSSGALALRRFPEVAPQLVLMDVMMPQMDGPETLRHLRDMPGGGDVPVVFMTARAQIHEQAAYRALGALAVIVKPFDPMTLSLQISEIWDLRHAA